ncbi:hypothetical protein NIES4074_54870 [Cylindrospermum sp. NIES-4074]|nr:hypothetical protein NIES4074_54870 [Cylindrospermum sp. NIES-4074]
MCVGFGCPFWCVDKFFLTNRKGRKEREGREEEEREEGRGFCLLWIYFYLSSFIGQMTAFAPRIREYISPSRLCRMKLAVIPLSVLPMISQDT